MSLFKGEKPFLGTTVVNPSKGDDDALTIQAVDSGQTGKLLSVKKSDGTVVASVANDGTTVGLANRNIITVQMTASSVDTFAFVADRAYTVKGVREIHSVVGGASAAVRPRKITNVSAPGAAAGANVIELTTAAIDLTATVNTAQVATLSATAADLNLAAGDKIGLDFSGTLTGLVGMIQIELQTA